MFLAQNRYSELKEVVKKINYLVQEKKYRYRDIAIITKNQEEYASLIKVIFDIAKIPVFVDEKKDLSENVFVKFLLSVLEVYAKGWSQESVLASIKTGFFDLPKDDIFLLENYCLKHGIQRKAWYEKDWNFEGSPENINDIRLKIVKPLVKLWEQIKKEKTVKNITKRIYEFLDELHVEKVLNDKINKIVEDGKTEIANEYISSIQIVNNTLDTMVELFGEEQITFEKYQELLKIGFKIDLLGKIPESLDQIMLGDVERSRSHKVKAVFILGVNDGIFPSFQKDEGFLNDSDRKELKKAGIELANGTYENLYEDQFNIYKSFSVAEEELYISYPTSDKEGKAIRPSVLIYRLKKMFPKIVEKSDVITEYIIENENTCYETLLEIIQKRQEGQQVDKIWGEVYNYYLESDKWEQRLNSVIKGLNDNDETELIDKENIKKLYGNVLKTSVSRLEQYRKCPFSYHLKYGLKLTEKPEYKLRNLDTGTFMHEIVEKFFEYIDVKEIKLKNLEYDDIEKIVNELIDEYLKLPKNYLYISTPKFKSLTLKLKRVVAQSLIYIVEQLKNSSFEVCGTEVEFSDNSIYEPIRLELDSGEKIEVTGKIDRIDIAQNENGKFLRIIDYKSSAKNIDLNEVVCGLQIQLLTYIDAATRIENAIPAGMLYFGLMEHIVNSRKSKEDLENDIKRQFKMNGMVLADVEVVKMMDKNLEKGYSNVIPVYIDKNGEISTPLSNTLSRRQFEILQKHITKIIKELSQSIVDGNIEIKPYYNKNTKKSACEYCEYKGICNFNPRKQDYFQIPIIDKEIIFENLCEDGGSKS